MEVSPGKVDTVTALVLGVVFALRGKVWPVTEVTGIGRTVKVRVDPTVRGLALGVEGESSTAGVDWDVCPGPTRLVDAESMITEGLIEPI